MSRLVLAALVAALPSLAMAERPAEILARLRGQPVYSQPVYYQSVVGHGAGLGYGYGHGYGGDFTRTRVNVNVGINYGNIVVVAGTSAGGSDCRSSGGRDDWRRDDRNGRYDSDDRYDRDERITTRQPTRRDPVEPVADTSSEPVLTRSTAGGRVLAPAYRPAGQLVNWKPVAGK